MSNQNEIPKEKVYLDCTNLLREAPSGIEAVLRAVAGVALKYQIIPIYWNEKLSAYFLATKNQVSLLGAKLILVDNVKSTRNYRYLLEMLDHNQGLKIQMIFHDLLPWYDYSWFPEHSQVRLLQQLDLAKRSQSVTCVSRDTLTRLQGILLSLSSADSKSPRISFQDLPYFPTYEECQSTSDRTKPRVNVLVLGNIEPRKNLLSGLTALEEISRKQPIKVTVVGANIWHMGNLETFLKSIRSPNLEINFNLNLSETMLNAVWLETDVFLYPSHAEGFGLPISESLARGIPTIGSKNVPAANLSSSSAHMFLASSGKPSDLYDALSEALNHVQCATKFSKITGQVKLRTSFEDWADNFCMSLIVE